jgi:hypothetical protein
MDSGWAVFWATVALVAVTVLVGFRRTPKSRMQYLPTHLQRLVTVPLNTDVSVEVEGKKVKNAFSMEVRIVNTGRTALPASEWEGPLFIDVSEGTEIISVSQIGATPVGVRSAIRLENNRVIVPAFLMNPGDMLAVQLVCEGTEMGVIAHARINNVPSVKRRRPPYPPGNGPDGSMLGFNKAMSYFFIPLFMIGFGVFISIGLANAHGTTVTGFVIFLICWWGLVLVVYPVFMWRALKTSRLWRPAEVFSSK